MNPPPNTFHITLWPFIHSLKNYRAPTLKADLMAGITVAIFAIPQAMAYAMLAGVPPVYGLYSAIILALLAALWGSSELVNTGPTNSAALLTAAAMIPFLANENYLETLFLFTLLVGILRTLLGLLKLGRLVDYVPESAFLGFTVGAGLLIAFGQLHHLLGLPASHAPWFPQRIYQILQHSKDLNPYTLLIGLGTLTGTLSLNRYAKRLPIALLFIALATAITQLLPASANIRTVKDIAPILGTLPTLHTPLWDWHTARNLLPAAFAVAIIGLIEAVSIGQILALKKNRHLNFNQEFFGQGISHIIGAFLQCIPGSGSFSRSALIHQCGGITRLSNIIYALAILLALTTIPHLLNLIPICALAGLLLYIGYKLIDIKKIQRVWITSKEDTLVMITTLLVTVFIKIEYGIYTGVILSALLYIHRSSPLKINELLPQPGDRFSETPYDTPAHHAPSDLIAIGIDGNLFYGQALQLRERLKTIVEQQNPRILILRARGAYSIDYTCWSALFDFAEILRDRGSHLYLCGVRPDFKKLLNATDKKQYIDPTHIYPCETAMFTGLRKAIQSSYQLLPPNPILSDPWQKHLQQNLHPTEKQQPS